MTRSLRPGKVFVDHSQNAAAKTTAAPYTPRARRRADRLHARHLGRDRGVRRPRTAGLPIDDLPARLERYGDLLAPLLDPDRARPLPPLTRRPMPRAGRRP